MTVSSLWTNPSAGGSLDLSAGAVVTEAVWDAMVSNFLWLGGPSGATVQVLSAVGTTSNPATTSSSLVALPDPSVTMTTLAGSTVVVWFNGSFRNSTLGANMAFVPAMDANGGVNIQTTIQAAAANTDHCISLVGIFAGVSAAAHVFNIYWLSSTGTGSRASVNSNLVVAEFRR
jgi:hypothetical protein